MNSYWFLTLMTMYAIYFACLLAGKPWFICSGLLQYNYCTTWVVFCKNMPSCGHFLRVSSIKVHLQRVMHLILNQISTNSSPHWKEYNHSRPYIYAKILASKEKVDLWLHKTEKHISILFCRISNAGCF